MSEIRRTYKKIGVDLMREVKRNKYLKYLRMLVSNMMSEIRLYLNGRSGEKHKIFCAARGYREI